MEEEVKFCVNCKYYRDNIFSVQPPWCGHEAAKKDLNLVSGVQSYKTAKAMRDAIETPNTAGSVCGYDANLFEEKLRAATVKMEPVKPKPSFFSRLIGSIFT